MKIASDGNRYCTKCLNAKGLIAQSVHDGPRSMSDVKIHLKLVAVFKSGRIIKGTAYKLDLAGETFHMLRIGGHHHGRRQQIRFSDLKAICHVKSFDGPLRVPSGPPSSRQTFTSGKRVTVHFVDGEFVEGFVHSRYRPDSPRFNLIPANTDGNVISMIVERDAVDRVEMGGSMKKLYHQELSDTPLRKKLLKQYWTNPSARVLMRHLVGMLDTTPDLLTEALRPYIQMKLAQIGNHGPDTFVAFRPPEDRALRDFIIRENRHLTPARQRGR